MICLGDQQNGWPSLPPSLPLPLPLPRPTQTCRWHTLPFMLFHSPSLINPSLRYPCHFMFVPSRRHCSGKYSAIKGRADDALGITTASRDCELKPLMYGLAALESVGKHLLAVGLRRSLPILGFDQGPPPGPEARQVASPGSCF